MNVFKQFVKSLYSPKDMATYRFQGIGKTILYIFILMLITSIPIGYQLGTTMTNGLLQLQEAMKLELPEFEMKNGVLTSESTAPIVTETESHVFVFDTTGEFQTSELNRYETVFALLKTEAIIGSENGLQTYRYQDFGNLTFTKAQLENMVVSVQDVLPIIIALILLLLYIFFTGLKFIGILFLSVIGLAIRKGSKKKLSYKQLWVLSAYAVTLPTTFFAITDYLAIYVPFSLAIYWIVAIYLLHTIITQIPKPRPRQTETEKPSEV